MAYIRAELGEGIDYLVLGGGLDNAKLSVSGGDVN